MNRVWGMIGQEVEEGAGESGNGERRGYGGHTKLWLS
jgi:hypothetical protein